MAARTNNVMSKLWPEDEIARTAQRRASAGRSIALYTPLAPLVDLAAAGDATHRPGALRAHG